MITQLNLTGKMAYLPCLIQQTWFAILPPLSLVQTSFPPALGEERERRGEERRGREEERKRGREEGEKKRGPFLKTYVDDGLILATHDDQKPFFSS